MDENFINSMVSTITMYQTAFNSFLKENDGEMALARDLTRDWWMGIMTMAGYANQKREGGGYEF